MILSYNITIDNSCYLTYPCTHCVKIFDTEGKSKSKYMTGTEIYRFLTLLEVDIPEHFKEYDNFESLKILKI